MDTTQNLSHQEEVILLFSNEEFIFLKFVNILINLLI